MVRFVFLMGRMISTGSCVSRRMFTQWDQRGHVQRPFQAVVLLLRLKETHLGTHFRFIQDVGEVQTICLPVIHRFVHIQAVTAAHHLLHCPETQLRHLLPHFLGDKPEKVFHELWFAVEFLAQGLVLCRHPDGDRYSGDIHAS